MAHRRRRPADTPDIVCLRLRRPRVNMPDMVRSVTDLCRCTWRPPSPSTGKAFDGHSSHGSPTPDRQPSRKRGTRGTPRREFAFCNANGRADPKRDFQHGPDDHGPGNSMIAEMPQNRLGEPGTGWTTCRGVSWSTPTCEAPARSTIPAPQHEIELHLTGTWNETCVDQRKKFSEDSEPIRSVSMRPPGSRW